MANFFIKRITASGKGKKDAVVELTQGMNIICGLSDTGKSTVLWCIDYIFGGSEVPFDERNTGYSCVKVFIETKNGNITLERKLGTNKVVVSSTNDDIESGKYDTKYSAKSNYPTISSLFLRLIGVNEEHELIKNKEFVTDRLTWRTFLHTFLIIEEEIHSKKSILLPKRKEANTLLISSLIFLLTGNDFAGFDKQEERRIRNAKKSEIVKHINEELQDLAGRKEKLEEQLAQFGDVDISENVRVMIKEVSAIKERIEQANERGKRLLGEIITVNEELADCELLINRYSSLRKHFVADIKRLTLIVDGEIMMEAVPCLEKCPFCDGDIQDTEHPNYIEASRSELTRIISQLEGLAQVEHDVKSRKVEIEGRIISLNNEKTDIDSLIDEELKPKEHELAEVLTAYRAVTMLQGELQFIERFADERTQTLRDKEKPEESKVEYRPKEHLDSNFRKGIDEYLKDIFTKCCFENLLTVHFDIDNQFDVSINGYNKATNHGKGFRAFANTLLALTIRKYLIDKGAYSPKLFFVDSPLLTLKQGVDDHAPESMKTALFRYLLESQDEGQVLVIENEIPELDYESYGVKPIRFTGGKSEGRYGFLYLDGQF